MRDTPYTSQQTKERLMTLESWTGKPCLPHTEIDN